MIKLIWKNWFDKKDLIGLIWKCEIDELKLKLIQWNWWSKFDEIGTTSCDHGALGETSDKSDFSVHAWDSFSQEIHNLLFVFYCQKSLNLLEMQWFSS